MAAFPEGSPCWANVVTPDIEESKRFYGGLLGWTFDNGATEFGGYTQAYSGGRNVAGLASIPPGTDMPGEWNIYFASPDVTATAAKIRAAGGEITMEPMQIGTFGSMLMARDPSGAPFGVWQPDEHRGFEKIGEPGAFAWMEVNVREVETTDAFYTSVFPLTQQQIGDGTSFDYKVFEAQGQPVGGRFKMGADIPADMRPSVSLYFAVDNCDDAVATAEKLSGTVRMGPHDSPHGRFAVVSDPQGATLTVIDTDTTVTDPQT